MTTLLIVDDRAINREVLSLLLEEYGYTTLEAEDGLQALELVKDNKIDLIITDIAMPGMDGLALAKALQADPILTKIPIIFYSATYQAVEAYRAGDASNIKYVLTKPCDPEIILGTIEGVLDPNSQFFNNKPLRISKEKEIGKEIEANPLKISNFKKKDKLTNITNINLRLTNLIEIGLDMSLEHDVEKLTYILGKGGRQFLQASYGAVLLKDLNDPSQYKHFIIAEDNTLRFNLIKIENFSESLKELFLSERISCLHSPVVDVKKLGFDDVNLPFSSLLILPLKTTKAQYGKIYFINKKKRHFFTPSDQRFMMTLADKFVVNYENIILYQAVEQNAKQLGDVTERLHLTLEAARGGTWVWSIQDDQLTLDKYACLLLGLKSESCVKTLEAFLHCLIPEDKSRVNTELSEFSLNGRTDPIEFRVLWPDKSIRYMMLRGKVYYNEKNVPSYMLGVYWDITEHIQAEEKLRAYRQQMAEIVRSNSLGEMASSLAHEINQPLTVISAYIKGCLKRFQNQKEVTPEILQVLHETSLEAERLGEMVHRIKNFVRKGELFYERTDINLMIDQAIQLIKQESQNLTAEIIYMPNKNLPHVEVDKIQIQQVILNLLRNAMEAMRETNIREPKIIISVHPKDRTSIVISIVDNGPGFPEQNGNRLFELYFTTKSQGMGLGLAICRGVIEAHSGQLTASVLPEGGSCFQFDLPVENRSKKASRILTEVNV